MTASRIVVCGATGFVGRNMVEALVRRGDLAVRAVHHSRPPFDVPGVEWVRADLTSRADVTRALEGAEIVVQAAATTSGAADIVTRPYLHVTDNAVMNALLFQAAHDLGVDHVVFFSCTVMYPSSATALREEDFTGEIHPRYFGVGWTKVYIEKLAEFYAGLGRTRYTVLRHSNLYGPHDKYDLERSHMFGATVTKVMTAQDGKIVVWGDGSEARDLLYIADLVDCVLSAIDRQRRPFALYNVGYGEAFPVREVVRRIVKASGRPLEIIYDKSQPSLKTSLFLDCSRVKDDLGWVPRVSLDEGIRRTLAWYRAHRPARAGGGEPDRRYIGDEPRRPGER